ncbi:agmatinase [Geodermatophilus sabuli]|uniref:Agmatinase n=1 Tax=Geodermatophilus sabuli TaxID=1564158 RepID=A0A285EDU4_9ACTN|nr:agmatinase [Geodermatophilus sabuli]MBB3084636.1 agmatinase [Geodermatophilus sabuli]SNX97170.1 agmatinase [Geodermatophilus sabuli]
MPDRPPDPRTFQDGPSYLGLPSFMKVPYLAMPEELDDRTPDVAIVGAPWDDSVVNRPGARFGPRSIRFANYIYPFWHLDLQVAPFDVLDVIDFGDAACVPGLVEESHKAIHDRVLAVAQRGIVPIVLGGDHSITYPSASAVAEAVAPRELGVIHFDAHADTADEVWGNLRSHGTPMRRLIESGAVAGRNFVQVGLRGYWPPPEILEWMHAQQMRWHLMGELLDRGVDAVIDTAIEEALDGPDVIYLSVDIDVLDPGFAPGTGTPEPGGMQPADLLRAIRRIAEKTNVIAMDVVEVSPPYDHAELTAQNANRCVLEAISALAVKHRDSITRAERGSESPRSMTNP